MRPMVLSVRSKAGLCLFIFSLLLVMAAAVTAQERVFEQYLRYLTEQEGYNLTDAIKEIQSLQQGREEIIQSYIKTEQDLQNLEKSAFSTQQSELDYYEKLYPQQELPNLEVGEKKASYSDDSFFDVPTADEPREMEATPISRGEYVGEKTFKKSLSNINESYNQELKPPRFRILSVKEYADEEGEPSLDITLTNSGAEGDVSVAIATKDGVLISQPFYRELRDFSGTKVLSFQLMQQPQQIAIQFETDGGTVRIPVFLRNTNGKNPVVINATPFEAECPVGESVEYQLTLEGDQDNPRRYKLRVENLPAGINSEILQAQTRYPVQSIKFSPAFKRHELILRLTLSLNLSTKLIGKAIPFLVALFGETDASPLGLKNKPIFEKLTITPLGLGKIAISAPMEESTHYRPLLEELLLPLGGSKKVKVTVENIGTADIHSLEIFTSDTIFGIESSCSPTEIALPIGETKEITITLSATPSARIGKHIIKISAQASGLSEEVTLGVLVQERETAFFGAIASKIGFFLSAMLVGIGIASAAYTFKRVAGKKEEFDEEVIEEEYV